jgi:glycerol kinase
MSSYIGAIDQGTTSTRFMVFDRSGRVVSTAQQEHEQIYPHPGWVKHDPEEIWRRTRAVIAEALAQPGLHASDLAAIGIANQRETTIVWDRKTGAPVMNAIVWQDARVAPQAARFAAAEFAKTGGPDRFLGTVDTFLAWHLTGGSNQGDGGVHVTDVTNASRTQLMNLATLDWDREILATFEIPEVMLPRIGSSSEIQGVTRLPELAGVPLAGILGDQQAALMGQTCFRPGEAKNTHGTGCFLLMNTGEQPVPSRYGLLTTVACKLGDAPAQYALEGGVAIAGALVSSGERAVAARQPGPDSIHSARGLIAGLTRYANKGRLARAALEATAYQTREVVEAMEHDSGIRLDVLRVDGGMVRNDLLMQFQADILDRPVGAGFELEPAPGIGRTRAPLRHLEEGGHPVL